MSRSITREEVERTITASSRTFKQVIIRYFGRADKVRYADLGQVNWDNVRQASVEFNESKRTYLPELGEVVRSVRRRVRRM